jgi:hypothetical protein
MKEDTQKLFECYLDCINETLNHASKYDAPDYDKHEIENIKA